MNQNININEVEKAILASIVFSQDYEVFEKISSVIKEDDFYTETNKNIFKAIKDVVLEELPLDEIYVQKKGFAYNVSDQKLIEVLSTNPITNVMAYVKEIKEYSLKRQLNNLSIQIKKSCMDADSKSSKIFFELKQQLDMLEQAGRPSVVQKYDINDIEEKDTEYICKDFLPFPKHQVSIVSASGGIGKTFAMIQAALRIIKSDPNEKVFAWFSEDNIQKIKFRTNHIAKNILEMDMEKYKGRFHISDDIPFDIVEEINRKLVPTEEFFSLKSELKEYSTIILDPLLGFYSLNENDNATGKRFMAQFVDWAKKEGKTIIFIHHANADGNRSRGASAFRDAARALYIASVDMDSDGKPIKNNHVNFILDKDNNNIPSIAQEFDNKKEVKRKVFPDLNNYAIKENNVVITEFNEALNSSKNKKEKSYYKENSKNLFPEPVSALDVEIPDF